MNICVVSETYWPDVNGVAMTLRRLTTGLVEHGHQVGVISTRNGRRTIDDVRGLEYCQEVPGFPLPGYSEVRIGLPAWRALRQRWLKDVPDVIYVATEGLLGWSAVQVATSLGIKVCSGFHTNFHRYSQYYGAPFLEKFVTNHLVTLHNRTRCTIVPTEDQRHALRDLGIADVRVIGRGVDTELFNPQRRDLRLRTCWSATPGDPVVIYVGRIAEEKNLDLTLRAAELMRARNSRIRCVVVGDGPALPRLRKDYPQTLFVGQKTGEDLARYYASADLFLFASTTETFGNVILEAMASGLAVIAYDYAAGRMHITSGQTGLLADIDDEQQFQKHAARLADDPVMIRNLRNDAASYATTQSWDAIVHSFEDLLAEVCGCEEFKLQPIQPLKNTPQQLQHTSLSTK